LWLGFSQQVRQMSRNVAKMMDALGVEVAELHETLNVLVYRRHWPVCKCLGFFGRKGNFTSRDNVAQVLHFLKTEDALFKTQFQAVLFESLKHKTHALEVFVQRSTTDIDVVEVDGNIRVEKSRRMLSIIRLNIAGALHNPNGMATHFIRPSSV
jgi:hypothetical protein